ncbi:MAG TPA: phosphoglycerate kinase, partial [bacterium]|nr:phosphoglycerate kinase [bacterium]
MNKKTIDDVNVCGKRVFVRCDFNVPLDENQQITDDERIVASLPTIKKLIKDGAILILASHLGRPKGERKPKYSLKPVAERLKKLLEKEIKMMDDCIGDEVEKAKLSAISGDVILLENLRFYKEEEKNEPEFAKKLAKNIDIYVNDAFGTAHRAHASTEGITKYVPVAAAGYLLEKEI